MNGKLKKFETLLRYINSNIKTVKINAKFYKDNECEITKIDLKTKLKKGEAVDDSDFEDDPDTPLYATIECPKDTESEKLKKCVN